MNRNNYCPFCHILVAPAASDRLERKGQAAHESCVRRHAFAPAVAACRSYLAGSGAAFAASAFEIKLPRAGTVRELARLIASVLRKCRDNAVSDQDKAEAAFRAEAIADQLLVEIDVTTPVPAVRPNGKAKTQSV
ncbi:MAG TPA: hypothetical protein VL500_04345 [Candidatus Eisenbacteria bacterium]|jgi:hypothetical protein|nr:hypothetical protein [Candidatus Eisenbacteria bacterium]